MAYRRSNDDGVFGSRWRIAHRAEIADCGIPSDVAGDDRRWSHVLLHGDDVETGWSARCRPLNVGPFFSRGNLDDDTFQLLRGCFEHDDGSLPGVELDGLTHQQLTDIYAYIRQGSRVSTKGPEFWHRRQHRSVALDAVPNAAELVASGDADAFHFCFTGLRVGAVELPELGLFVFRDSVELDYRMGAHWTREAIAAFFGLLRELCRIAPQATVGVPSVEPPPEPDRFLDAWSRLRRTAC